MGEYLNVIPKIRVYEKKLIDKSKIDRILDFDIDDVFKFLSEINYASNISENINETNYEYVLSLELNKLFLEIDYICKDKDLLNMITMKYKYANIKSLLKSKLLGSNDEILFKLFNIDNEKLSNAINNEVFGDLDISISCEVKALIDKFKDNNIDYKQIDFVLDKLMFKNLKQSAIFMKDDFIIKYVNILIDVFNLKSIFRMRKLGLDKKIFDSVIGIVGTIPLNKLQSLFLDSKENILLKFSTIDLYKYVKEGLDKFITYDEINTLELELDNSIIEFIRSGKIVTSGLLPIIGYVNAKESELRNIRFIIVSKLNNVPPEIIKRRLISNYV